MLHLYTFGGLRIESDGQPLRLPTQKARELLAYLITFRDRSHPRSVLVGTFWPDLPEGRARHLLSDTLWRVRRALGEYVIADERFLRFNTDMPYWLDAEEFERALAEERGAVSPAFPDPARARSQSAAMAVELYLGPYLDGLHGEWALLEQERLRGRYLQLLQHLLEEDLQAGDYPSALKDAERLVAAEPLHEAAHRELMRLYHLLDRDVEAVGQYRRCCQILREQLGVAPAPETEALYVTLVRSLPGQVELPTARLPTPTRRPPVELDTLPLAGRDTERDALLDHLEAAVSGRGGLVLLEGEPGIGKTRLAQEIVAGARWRNIGVTLIFAQAADVSSSSYALFLAALEPLLMPRNLDRVAAIVEPLHLQAAAPLIPHLAEVVADRPPLPDLPPPQARERLQQALITLILGLARLAPHLWVLEDLHWADAETLALLPLLYPRLKTSRALFLLTGRSADLRTHPAAWKALQAMDRIEPFPRYTLDRLRSGDIDALVHSFLEGDTAVLAEHLSRDSEGVPLYLVETLKAWRDGGYLQPTERGTWRCLGALPADLVSHLGDAVIDYRLSRLSSAAEDVAAAAAVIGTEADYDLLSQVCTPSGEAPDKAAPELSLLIATDELLRMGLLTETNRGYSFSHEQVRQALYSRLPSARRQRLHHRVALGLEKLFPEQFELLAHHFAAAGERKQTIHYLTRAAGRDRGLFAHQAALARYDDLLALLTRPEDRPGRYDVLHKRAEVLDWIGDREAQGRDLEEMLELARSLGDTRRLAKAMHLRSGWHWIQGQYEAADCDARAALDLYGQLGDDHGRAALLTQLGRNVAYTGQCSQATAYLQEALGIHEAVGDLEGQIAALMGLAGVVQYEGDLSRSLAYCRRSLDLAREAGDERLINRTTSSVGLAYIDLGDMDTAEIYLREALQFAERSGERRQQAITYAHLGTVAIEQGDLETGETRFESALRMFREVQDTFREAYALSFLGELSLLREDPAAAEKHFRVARQRCQEIGAHDFATIYLSYLAVAEAAMGKEAAALEHSRRVVAKAKREWPGAECPPEIYYNHFRVAEATRQWAAARSALEQAAQIIAGRAEHISDPAWRQKYLTGLRANRAIAEGAARLPAAGCLRVRLARTDAPLHRRPRPEELVEVTWTVDAGEQDAALAQQEGKVAQRRQRILRLLVEAEAAGGQPTVDDLAGALQVSPRTVRADLSALRHQGHAVRTRGSPA